MSRFTLPALVLVFSHIALATALATTYHLLPQRVATHFDAAGTPNDWMTRPLHVGLMWGTAVGLSLLLVGVFYCVRFFPASLINLPRKDYWLAPERRVETCDFLLRMGLWLASFETLFLLTLHLLVVSANRSQPVRLSAGVWLLLVGFLLLIGGWIFTLVARFYRQPETA